MKWRDYALFAVASGLVLLFLTYRLAEDYDRRAWVQKEQFDRWQR